MIYIADNDDPLSDEELMSGKDNNNLACRNLYGIIQGKLIRYSQGSVNRNDMESECLIINIWEKD